jgi:hypothetical protein
MMLPLLCLGAVGCGPYLQYRAAKPAPVQNGRIVIDVRDGREPKAGGSKHEEVGFHRGSFADAARAAGFGVTDGPGATARVVVDVQRLWCAGYGGYHAAVSASISVLDPSGQQIRVPGVPVTVEDGGINCKRMFRHTLTEFFRATHAMFSNPNVAVRLTQ